MRKYITLSEKSDNNESVSQNVSNTLMSTSSRYAGSCHQPMASDRLYSNQDDGRCTQTVSLPLSSDIQPVKPVHIPRALAAAPFLQYPRLTPGQRSYLCSISHVYSAEHVRKLIQQHYLNMLHRCTQEDPCPFKDSRNEEVSMIGKECLQVDVDMTTGPRIPSRSRRHSGDNSMVAAVHSVKSILPKIPMKQTRKVSRPPASKEIKPRKPKIKVPRVQMASMKGSTRLTAAGGMRRPGLSV